MLASKLSSLIFVGKTHWGESLTVLLRIFEAEKEHSIFFLHLESVAGVHIKGNYHCSIKLGAPGKQTGQQCDRDWLLNKIASMWRKQITLVWLGIVQNVRTAVLKDINSVATFDSGGSLISYNISTLCIEIAIIFCLLWPHVVTEWGGNVPVWGLMPSVAQCGLSLSPCLDWVSCDTAVADLRTLGFAELF